MDLIFFNKIAVIMYNNKKARELITGFPINMLIV